MGWTAERIEQLTEMWSAGLPASHIASALSKGGDKVSRNAVLGMVHRRGIKFGGSAAGAAAATDMRKKQTVKAKAERPRGGVAGGILRRVRGKLDGAAAGALGPRAISRAGGAEGARRLAGPEDDGGESGGHCAAAPAPLMLALVDLGRSTCRWPIGDPLQAGFGFCGHDTDEGQVYCPAHRARSTYGAKAMPAAEANKLIKLRGVR